MPWQPRLGPEATGVATRSRIDEHARDRLLESSAEILGAGVNPQTALGRSTGLIVGYVQSGKTLSFTTVIGYARDNGFPLVIVVAGNKTSLLAQSHSRLSKDLNVEGGDGLPAWIMEKNPRAQDAQYEQLLTQTIANWRDNTRDADEKPTLLLTVLKQNQRLNSLANLLRNLDLRGVPILVIDDEADQASLNTKVNEAEESTTYTRLRELRDVLPCHTLLQYTATPQAPLLINIADVLSPDFVRVLDPGDGYVGGAEFFTPNSRYVRVIPAEQIPARDAIPVEPPQSFLDALRVYFVGLATSIITRSGRRSMLVHPAREKAVHQESAQWASAAKTEWLDALQSANDPDRDEVLADFRLAYDDLATTEPRLPDFANVVEKLPRALRNTTVIEFNTRGRPRTPEINWRNAEGWILVGGQAVDRGFTVDSLSVTYMPRGIGGGNADTLQQRARFFGYKRGYLGICRVYLEGALRDAFVEYVEHEHLMRAELRLIAADGTDLRRWRRRLVLDPGLHPCRRSVISDEYHRARPGGGWTSQRGALMTPGARERNTQCLAQMVAGMEFAADTTHPSDLAAQRHEVAPHVPLQHVVDALSNYVCEDPRDTTSFTGLLVSLGAALRANPRATAVVYRMRPTARGQRKVSADGSIENFQQGRTALADGGTGYPGDGVFRSTDHLSVQIHKYDLERGGNIVARDAPLIAYFVPRALAKAWLVQLQAGQ